MERSTALESARTKRPGDPEGNPEVALRGTCPLALCALTILERDTEGEMAAERVLLAYSRASASFPTDDKSIRWNKEQTCCIRRYQRGEWHSKGKFLIVPPTSIFFTSSFPLLH